jgi:hypothetical protein
LYSFKDWDGHFTSAGSVYTCAGLEGKNRLRREAMKEKFVKMLKFRLFVLALLLGVTSAICLAQAAPTTAPATSTPDKKAAKSKTKSAPVDPSTIPQAPGGGDGKVWVNTNTKVFHKEGDPWYGKTKHGSYMTEADAVKGGFHEAKDSPVGKKDTTKK